MWYSITYIKCGLIKRSFFQRETTDIITNWCRTSYNVPATYTYVPTHSYMNLKLFFRRLI